MANLKDRVIGKMANYVRNSKRLERHLRDDAGRCKECGSAPDELHDVTCPLYTLEGVRMDINMLFYGIRTPEEAAKNPKAL